MTCICWLHGSCLVDKPGDKHFLQPRSQGSLLPALRSIGRVGENPGNEVALSPLDTYESYNSTTNISGVLPTRQASKFLRPLNGSICPLDSSFCLVDYHFFHSYDSTTITRGLLQTRQAPKFPRGVPLGILGGAVSPGSSNPDPISDQKMLFSTPVFRLEL